MLEDMEVRNVEVASVVAAVAVVVVTEVLNNSSRSCSRNSICPVDWPSFRRYLGCAAL